MVDSHTKRANEIHPDRIKIHFSENMRKGFLDLAAAMNSSRTVDEETLLNLQNMAGSDSQTATSFIVCFPAIAMEVGRHVQATGDRRAADAWQVIENELVEKGFTLEKSRGRDPRGGGE